MSNTVAYSKLESDSRFANKGEFDQLEESVENMAVSGGKIYATLANANADLANIEQNERVEIYADSTLSNNGIWVKNTSNVLVFARGIADGVVQDGNVNPVSGGEVFNYTSDAVESLQKNDDDVIFELNDLEGNTTIRQTKDGEVFIPSMAGKSIQEEVKNKYLNGLEDDIFHFEDAEENITFKQSNDGNLHVTNLESSIQDNIKSVTNQYNVFKIESHNLLRDMPKLDKALLNLFANKNYAQLPVNLAYRNYDLPNILGNLTIQMDSLEMRPIPTPYGNDYKVVHPYVLDFNQPIRGYKYLMTINPYAFEYEENPIILGSNDTNNWELLKGFKQPIALPPTSVVDSFLSDSLICYDYINGDNVIIWRETERRTEGTFTKYLGKRTKDFLHFSEKELIMPEIDNAVDGMTSPSILFNTEDGLWYNFYVKGEGVVVYRTSSDLKNWSESTNIFTGNPAWHIEVKICGNKLVMLINKRGTASNFYLATSDNWTTWTYNNTPLFTANQDNVYKASFLPKIEGNLFWLEIFYTTNHTAIESTSRKFFKCLTNKISI